MDADETQKIHQFLSGGEWFGGLAAPLQGVILSRSVVRNYAKGEVISLEASVPKGLFALLEGEIHTVREVGSGDESLLHVCEPGFWFGEYGVLTGKLTVVSFIARAQVKALYFSKAQFDRTLAEHPHYYEAFARLAIDRYGILLGMFAELRELGPEARLRSRLASLAQLRRQDRSERSAVSLTLSQADLARMVGVSRQTLNVLLGKLNHAGLIEVGFRHIRVPDANRLADPDAALEVDERESRAARARLSQEPLRASGEQID